MCSSSCKIKASYIYYQQPTEENVLLCVLSDCMNIMYMGLFWVSPNYKMSTSQLQPNLWCITLVLLCRLCFFISPLIQYSWINATWGSSHGSHNSWDKSFLYTLQTWYAFFSPALHMKLRGNSQSYLTNSLVLSTLFIFKECIQWFLFDIERDCES